MSFSTASYPTKGRDMLTLSMSVGLSNSGKQGGYMRARHFLLNKLGAFRVPKLKGVKVVKPPKIKAIKLPKMRPVKARGFPKFTFK